MKMNMRYSILLCVTIFGCTSTDPEDVPWEAVRDSLEYVQIDSTLSVVTWITSDPSRTYDGTIAIKTGRIGLMEDSLVLAEIRLDMNAITVATQSDDENRDFLQKMGTESFLHLSAFPESFLTLRTPEAVSLTPGNLPDSITLSGEILLKGTSRTATLPASIVSDGNEVTIRGELSALRTDWNLLFPDESPSELDSGSALLELGFYVVVPLKNMSN